MHPLEFRDIFPQRHLVLDDNGQHLCYATVTGAPQVGAVQQTPDVTQQSQAVVPFRAATVERVSQLSTEGPTAMLTTTQRVIRNVEGAGYMYGVFLDIQGTGSVNNGSNVAFAEDGPQNVINSIVLKDVNGESVNLGGWNCYLENVMTWQGKGKDFSASQHWSKTTGVSASAGNFHIGFRVPAGINRRDLVGILGNQDRAQKFELRQDWEASGTVFTTAPGTTLPSLTAKKYYENYTVPLPQGPTGSPQQILPDFYGTIRFATVMTSETTPAGSSTTTHFLRRIGNTVRAIALVFRQNASRSSANGNMPNSITFKAGDDTLFTEDSDYRQWLNWERYGMEVEGGPGLFNGVLVYENLHDFTGYIAAELGDDYYHTNALVNAQFILTMPAGFGSTNNSLNILTDDMIYATPVNLA